MLGIFAYHDSLIRHYQTVKGLIFDFPAGATPTHQLIGIVLANSEVCNPGEVLRFAPLDFPIL